MPKGVFIVLEGNDGSGKATQTELLLQRFLKEGRKAEKIDFPKYDGNIYGKLIGECLAGQHGDFLNLDPKIASTLYAVDRYESSHRIRTLLEEGTVMVADRYVGANQMHQGGKIADSEEREKFLLWLDSVEFGILNIPRPDVSLYLRVPPEISLELLTQKRAAKNASLGEVPLDVVEEDRLYLERSIETADWLIEREGWKKIECVGVEGLRTREDIHEEIWKTVNDI